MYGEASTALRFSRGCFSAANAAARRTRSMWVGIVEISLTRVSDKSALSFRAGDILSCTRVAFYPERDSSPPSAIARVRASPGQCAVDVRRGRYATQPEGRLPVTVDKKSSLA